MQARVNYGTFAFRVLRQALRAREDRLMLAPDRRLRGRLEMYGTVARTRVKPENRDELPPRCLEKQSAAQVTGFVAGYMLYENDSDAA